MPASERTTACERAFSNELERLVIIRFWLHQTKDYLRYALHRLKLRDGQCEGDVDVIVGFSHDFECKARATEFSQA